MQRRGASLTAVLHGMLDLVDAIRERGARPDFRLWRDDL